MRRSVPIAFVLVCVVVVVAACGGDSADGVNAGVDSGMSLGPDGQSDTAAGDGGPTGDSGAERDAGTDAADSGGSGGFAACAANCRNMFGTGGGELILNGCGNDCGPTCGSQNLYGKDETCTRCMVSSNQAVCTRERASCNRSGECAAALACFGTCI